ncbi:hypothetical protein C8F01DRAFT_1228991 [Mycena amicta]|nr:hypothetical protein C8F01DRAFT_1228991 [Mycena amicta]
MSFSAPSTLVDVGPTVGALQVGVLVAVCLFGAVTVQTILYFTRFPSDTLLLKALVTLVWCLDFSHTLAICYGVYEITVVQYGHPELLEYLPVSLNLAALISGFVGPLQQAWYAYRVYKFGKSPYVPCISMSLSVMRLAMSITLGASVLSASPISVADFSERWGWLVESLLLVGAVNDLLLVWALCFYLSRWRGEGFERMNRLVTRLMHWSIETGLVTSVGALFLLISFLAMQTNFVWIGMSVVLCKLFSNSLLFTLNARRRSLHTAPELQRRDSVHSLHSADALTTEFKFADINPQSRDRSLKRSMSISTPNSYIFPWPPPPDEAHHNTGRRTNA